MTRRQVTINLPVNGSPHDYSTAIHEAISANSGDALNQAALSGLLAQIQVVPRYGWSLAEDLHAEDEHLRRRMVHATRPKGPLSLDDAITLHKRMGGESR